jgi:hypothetical protein
LIRPDLLFVDEIWEKRPRAAHRHCKGNAKMSRCQIAGSEPLLIAPTEIV